MAGDAEIIVTNGDAALPNAHGVTVARHEPYGDGSGRTRVYLDTPGRVALPAIMQAIRAAIANDAPMFEYE